MLEQQENESNQEFYQRTRPVQEYDPDIPGVGGWFPLENREELERLIRKHEVKTVIEIGCMVGLSTAWFAQRVKRVTCVDRWYEPATVADNNNLVNVLRDCGLPRNFRSIFESNMKRVGVWDRLNIVQGDSSAVADQVEEADLVYVDADHSYAGCSSDIRLYYPKARKVICGDDYDVREDFAVIEAVRDLLPEHQSRKPFWWVEKV